MNWKINKLTPFLLHKATQIKCTMLLHIIYTKNITSPTFYGPLHAILREFTSVMCIKEMFEEIN